jgi:hypothetical protein
VKVQIIAMLAFSLKVEVHLHTKNATTYYYYYTYNYIFAARIMFVNLIPKVPLKVHNLKRMPQPHPGEEKLSVCLAAKLCKSVP